LISTVVSLPGIILHFVGSDSKSSGVADWRLAEEEGDNRNVEERVAFGGTGVKAREGGCTKHEPGIVVGDLEGATRVSIVRRPEFGDIVWMDFGGGDFCVFSDDSCGFGSNPERND
jgi:hypothetical protein